MSAIQSWRDLLGASVIKISREESLLFEVEFFSIVCKEIKEKFRKEYSEYFRIMKFTREMEDAMLENEFLRLIIHDILTTGEYTLKGIANYTNTHEEVVQEVIYGLNLNPSANFFQRLIELHRSVRRELYQIILKKIFAEYQIIKKN